MLFSICTKFYCICQCVHWCNAVCVEKHAQLTPAGKCVPSEVIARRLYDSLYVWLGCAALPSYLEHRSVHTATHYITPITSPVIVPYTTLHRPAARTAHNLLMDHVLLRRMSHR